MFWEGNYLINFSVIAIVVLIVLALVCDIHERKIKNSITFPFIIAGLMINTISDGMRGLAYSVTGMVLPVIILLLFYILRMLGAGDIKLFCSIGSILGGTFALNCIITSRYT